MNEQPVSYSRIAGRIVIGIALGILLLPALIELASIVGNITAFKYQAF